MLHIRITLALGLAALLLLVFVAYSNASVVDVRPADARDHAVVTVTDGFGATIGNTVYTLTGFPTIAVSAQGFRSIRRVLQAADLGATIIIDMVTLPAHMEISTHPTAANTRWSLDGRLTFAGAVFSRDAPAGTHSIAIDNPYYQRKQITVALERGKTTQLTEKLTPVSGQIHIKTTPAGASIRINGTVVGTSPLSLTKAGGRYQIEVTHRDYQPIVETIEVTHTDSAIERDYRLLLPVAYLHVDALPVGGTLMLDGKMVSTGVPLSVTAGEAHMLRYARQGYFSQHQPMTVAPGATAQAAFRLKAEVGTVSISSVPQASVKLVTERAVKLAESPRLLTNAAGIELKLFRPVGSFVMGAPRAETGQRANEFLRSVRLTQPFYISTHEVSRAQYGRFRHVAGAGNEPVTSISWLEAARYCNWLSRQEHLTPFYDIRNDHLTGANRASDGYRLPTEAEWEWLARKAFKPVQSRFSWGDATTVPEKAGNIADESANGAVSFYVPNYVDGFAGVAPVGSYPPDGAGLYDVTGNVSEWVHDVYTLVPPQSTAAELDPMGEPLGDTHTVKGSNWRSGTITELRASYREGEKGGRDDIGFRVARYLHGGSNEQ